MVRDYIETLTDVVADEVLLSVDLGGLEERVARVRSETIAASRAQVEAAKRSRELARALRELGLSVTDTAEVMQVSRGRVSQLVQ